MEKMDLKRELLNEESSYEIVLWRRGIGRVIECGIELTRQVSY
jgi:hypothetical protein